ncbi:MAG: Na+/H+ antiporter subunit E [Mogibacterium sp.]|nr:Na+/H+ antiporter subunit E [Mogibacterium sp.]
MKNFFTDKKLQSNPFVNWLELFVLLAAIWFILSEIFERKFMLYGFGSALVISLFCLDLFRTGGLKTDRNYFIIHVNIFRFLAYLLWLIKEIIKSSLSVTKRILKGNRSLNPQIVWFKADYDNPAARALLANSITLTPGTITVDIYQDGVYSVHALADEYAEGLLDGTMQRKVAWVFNEEIDYKQIIVEEEEASETILRLIPKVYKGNVRRR